jgi:hypothetical protein
MRKEKKKGGMGKEKKKGGMGKEKKRNIGEKKSKEKNKRCAEKNMNTYKRQVPCHPKIFFRQRREWGEKHAQNRGKKRGRSKDTYHLPDSAVTTFSCLAHRSDSVFGCSTGKVEGLLFYIINN